MIYAGIDAGSRAVKVVLLDGESLEVVGSGLADQSLAPAAVALTLLDETLCTAGLQRSDIARTVATGYARNLIGLADATITEITCHARGVRHLVPAAMTVVEIGGQDSKLLRLRPNGSLRDFAMNDRCAAGTGRFLEMVAERLEIPLDRLGGMAARSRQPAAISSMCVVFAETEIIGLLATGTAPEDVVAGVQAAIATRVAGMTAGQVTPPLVLTGGVALVSGMCEALAAVIGVKPQVAPQPQYTGALGAALLACAAAEPAASAVRKRDEGP
jgi:predicted CoA-substrate-specific enzyme activase